MSHRRGQMSLILFSIFAPAIIDCISRWIQSAQRKGNYMRFRNLLPTRTRCSIVNCRLPCARCSRRSIHLFIHLLLLLHVSRALAFVEPFMRSLAHLTSDFWCSRCRYQHRATQFYLRNFRADIIIICWIEPLFIRIYCQCYGACLVLQLRTQSCLRTHICAFKLAHLHCIVDREYWMDSIRFNRIFPRHCVSGMTRRCFENRFKSGDSRIF